MKTDIEIAQEAKMLHIREVAEKLGIAEDELELYGKYKAKLSDELIERVKDEPDGKLILVTAINPTPVIVVMWQFILAAVRSFTQAIRKMVSKYLLRVSIASRVVPAISDTITRSSCALRQHGKM